MDNRKRGFCLCLCHHLTQQSLFGFFGLIYLRDERFEQFCKLRGGRGFGTYPLALHLVLLLQLLNPLSRITARHVVIVHKVLLVEKVDAVWHLRVVLLAEGEEFLAIRHILPHRLLAAPHHYAPVSSPVVLLRDVIEFLLPSRVPKMHLHIPSLDLELKGEKVDGDSGLGVLTEALPLYFVENASFADCELPQDNQIYFHSSLEIYLNDDIKTIQSYYSAQFAPISLKYTNASKYCQQNIFAVRE